jgi:hypothetical protein
MMMLDSYLSVIRALSGLIKMRSLAIKIPTMLSLVLSNIGILLKPFE